MEYSEWTDEGLTFLLRVGGPVEEGRPFRVFRRTIIQKSVYLVCKSFLI
jgi:hypothetical protein